LKELEAFDFNLALTGFDSREIDEFLKPPAAATPEENIPDPPAVPVTRPGDIWLLGEAPVCPHCGAEN
jgi:site-specific DNA-methyltransferase (adenine-specific)